ncbi:MAG TPA: NAD(P)/FAD-dependent oxidoreductase [Chloroflexota bacterium]
MNPPSTINHQPSTRQHDVIVVGGGHNGLVCAAYLARGGKRVLVLERRHLVGGAAVTEEIHPGFRYSSAAYLVSLMQPRIIRELELDRYGYEVFPKEPAYFAPFPDGRYFFMWRDLGRTCEEIAKFSRRDAERYPEYELFLERLAVFIEPTLLEPPPNVPPREMRDWVALGRLGLRMLRLGSSDMVGLVRMLTVSVKDLLDRWFESSQLKVALASDGVIGTNGGPRTPGTAYVLLHHQMGGVGGVRGLWGFARGGMGAVSNAIAEAARWAGAEIRTESPVERILVRGDEAYGVVLEGGDELYAPIVVSNCDPKRTFLKLLDARVLPDEFRCEVEAFRCTGSSFKVNLALDALPEYTALPGAALGPQHRGTTHICPDVDYMERAWDDAKHGRTSGEPLLEITIPTAYDPSLAPPGKHVMSVFVQYAPYQLRDTDWAEEKERFADRVIDTLAQYAPNIRNVILHRHCLSPLDLETEFGMTGGNIFHGEMSPDQLFSFRPVPGWARYATPIRNLYLCGSGTHPGGGVMGAPGYVAASVILSASRRA